jgi:hypothetical protein
MGSSLNQQAARTARDAHVALRSLQRLVDTAVMKVHRAELEMVGVAIGVYDGNLESDLRAAVEIVRSPELEAALSEARGKMEATLVLHSKTQEP